MSISTEKYMRRMYRREKKSKEIDFEIFVKKIKDEKNDSFEKESDSDFLCTIVIVIVFISYCMNVVLLHKRNALLTLFNRTCRSKSKETREKKRED